eukprot:FR738251.1.p2 GENE.FR738251.1~~FR738251.1.p2  ORF type:complete len:103 (-),score=0.65 FR738251.1:153-461(-)
MPREYLTKDAGDGAIALCPSLLAVEIEPQHHAPYSSRASKDLPATSCEQYEQRRPLNPHSWVSTNTSPAVRHYGMDDVKDHWDEEQRSDEDDSCGSSRRAAR